MVALLPGFGFDTGFTMIGMRAALRAEFLQYQSLGIVLFILITRIVPALALSTG